MAPISSESSELSDASVICFINWLSVFTFQIFLLLSETNIIYKFLNFKYSCCCQKQICYTVLAIPFYKNDVIYPNYIRTNVPMCSLVLLLVVNV